MEHHHPILGMLWGHRGQVKREEMCFFIPSSDFICIDNTTCQPNVLLFPDTESAIFFASLYTILFGYSVFANCRTCCSVIFCFKINQVRFIMIFVFFLSYLTYFCLLFYNNISISGFFVCSFYRNIFIVTFSCSYLFSSLLILLLDCCVFKAFVEYSRQDMFDG